MQDAPGKLGGVLRAEPWLNIVVAVLAIAGVLWSGFMYFARNKDVDLTVWERQDIPISLPKEARELPIFLTVGRDTVDRAVLLDVLISNSGSKPIGSDKDAWELSLGLRDAGRIILLPNVTRRPQNLRVQARFDTVSKRIALSVGLLNPKDEIGLRLLVTGPATVYGPRLTAQSRVPGLTEPLVTRYDVRERFEKAFFVPIWFLFFVPLLVALLLELWQLRARFTPIEIIFRVLGSFFMAGYAAGAVAYCLAWLLARFATMVTS